MFKINLIPEIKQQQQKTYRYNTMATTVIIIVAIIVGVIVFGLLSYNLAKSRQLSDTNKDISSVEQSLEPYKALEETVITLQNGLTDIKQIINGGSKWSKFFTELEKATPEDTQVTSFDIKGNEITMDVTGKDVNSIDRFIKSFSNFKVKTETESTNETESVSASSQGGKNLFQNVNVAGYSAKGDGKVTFQAKMSLVEGLLW
ncbi:MAG: PilN domain-containing protein [bacterium]